ncbi:VOC family protein [Salipiger sp. P9]|uniref:VOC family protein n=1 Tax=Salipiger pentaromativorans TaxID=2943193 RepID=UPI0021587BB4|nr:VOC family protein [Salipiger pentaromativorans]MCR8548010.1 VOC family protein [Salipiger pentaromativorans]
MPTPSLFLLYVTDPLESAVFYETLFGAPPAARFPSYVSFAFENGTSVGLWSTSAQDFLSGGSGHRCEIAFLVASDDEVQALHNRWRAAGVIIEQPPAEAVFGLTFVALDPDGHRIRVCTPDA